MSTLAEKIVAVDVALTSGTIPHAFGGALALAYATEEPRGTRDIDVNVFVERSQVADVFAALPADVRHGDADLAAVDRDEQVRLFWDDTPIDVFFSASPAHATAAGRVRRVEFAGRTIPVLAPEDLTVFKVLFDRSKDWVDIETMLEAGTVNVPAAISSLVPLIGSDDRIARLRRLAERLTQSQDLGDAGDADE
jgi:hypothetical protein